MVQPEKRRFGDRYDGYKVTDPDPLFYITPYIMRSRLDSQVFFEEEIDVTDMRKFVLQHRDRVPELSLYHVIAAAVVRTIAQKPRINRFISGNKIYARKYIRASMTIKKSFSEDAEEMLVMPEFEKDATLFDVADEFHKCVDEAKRDGENGDSTDGTQALVKIINMCPGFIIKAIIGTLRGLDNRGKMPKFINRLSPFHSSIYITNVGSIGLGSVYHHLYEFGTTSLFLAIGKLYSVKELQSDGTLKTRNKIKIRIVVDERICDGFYFAQAIKHFRHLMNNPELLLEKPDYISTDR